MYKTNTAISNFVIGKFISTTDGSEITSGTPVGKYMLDGTGGTLSGTIAYDATSALWKINSIAQAETNGALLALTFTLTGALPVTYVIKLDTKLVSDLNDLTAANITTQCTASLNSYDPPTRAELTSDTSSIIAQIDANETKIDTVITNVNTAITNTNTIITDVGTNETKIDAITTIVTLLKSLQAGNIRDKSGEAGTYEILSTADGTTVVATLTLSSTTPYRTMVIS